MIVQSVALGLRMAQLDWVLPYLAIGPRPNDELDWQALQKAGITLIIDLNDNSFERQRAAGLRIGYRGLRVDDPPDRLERLMTIFSRIRDWIDLERNREGRVFLHCTAGQQRSPTCAMAYLMANGENKQDAERKVKEARLGVWAGPAEVNIWEQALDLWASKLSLKSR